MSLDIELIEYAGDSDDFLASAAKAGDRPHSVHARNALYLRHFDHISAMLARAKRIVAIMSHTDSSIEAEDVVQQSFLIFCHLLDTWHGNPQEETFLFYLSRHMPSHATHFVRDTLHYRATTRVVNQQPVESAVSHQPDSEDLLEAEVQSNIFWADHTRNLTGQSYRWITLRYSLGLTTAQIADLSGLSPRTIDRHLNAALTQIRQDIQSTWENCA